MQIGIIGAGKMGGWFAKFFQDVLLYDLDPGKAKEVASSSNATISSLEDVLSCDAILLAVPLSRTKEVIGEIGTSIEKDKILMEISSFKSDIAESFSRLECRKLSIHPMFGPSVKSVKGENLLVITDLSDRSAMDDVLPLFKDASIYECTLAEHEDAMSVVLGLPYAMNDAFYKMTKDLPEHFHGPTFRKQLSLAEKLSSEDPGFCSEVINQSKKKIKEYCSLLSEE